MIVRCDLLRATFRGTPFEARLAQIEFRTLEQIKERERAAEADRSLAAIRKIIQEDPEGVRRVEVEAMFVSALKKAGTRTLKRMGKRKKIATICSKNGVRRKKST